MSQDAPTSGQHPDDDGWTHVKPKSNRGKRRVDDTAVAVQEPSLPRTEGLRPPEELDADYHKIRSQWEASPCDRHLRDIVATRALSSPSVTRAVCLGIGTFDPADGAWEAKRRTYVQLIAFLVMIEEIGTIPSSLAAPMSNAP